MFHGVIQKITLVQFFFQTRCTAHWLFWRWWII